MKIKDLRDILAQAEELYISAGNSRAAAGLRKFRDALAVHDAKTVDAFVKFAAKIKP